MTSFVNVSISWDISFRNKNPRSSFRAFLKLRTQIYILCFFISTTMSKLSRWSELNRMNIRQFASSFGCLYSCTVMIVSHLLTVVNHLPYGCPQKTELRHVRYQLVASFLVNNVDTQYLLISLDRISMSHQRSLSTECYSATLCGKKSSDGLHEPSRWVLSSSR